LLSTSKEPLKAIDHDTDDTEVPLRLSFSVGAGSSDFLFLGYWLHLLPELFFLVELLPQTGSVFVGIGKLVLFPSD
jgi:hypothetical protein